MKKLNLGCGRDIKKEYINLDVAKLQGVDVVWDINKLPLPFKDNEFDEILCQDVLEHVDYIPLLKDIHRILKKGGVVKIRVPHFTSRNFYSDPTHIHGFSGDTLKFFLKNHKRNYYFNFGFSKYTCKLTFDKRWYLPWNYLLEFLFRLDGMLVELYELTPMRIFPAQNLIILLKK